jgi:formylglycine-generating enzyme required for sulfatase activity
MKQVIRGGVWYYVAPCLQSVVRGNRSPDNTYFGYYGFGFGFRLVREKKEKGYFIRGGCWDYDASYLQSAARDSGDPNSAYYACGFRLVKEKL